MGEMKGTGTETATAVNALFSNMLKEARNTVDATRNSADRLRMKCDKLFGANDVNPLPPGPDVGVESVSAGRYWADEMECVQRDIAALLVRIDEQIDRL